MQKEKKKEFDKKAYMKEYYRKNKEKIKETAKKHYEENKEKILKDKQQYYIDVVKPRKEQRRKEGDQ